EGRDVSDRVGVSTSVVDLSLFFLTLLEDFRNAVAIDKVFPGKEFQLGPAMPELLIRVVIPPQVSVRTTNFRVEYNHDFVGFSRFKFVIKRCLDSCVRLCNVWCKIDTCLIRLGFSSSSRRLLWG